MCVTLSELSLITSLPHIEIPSPTDDINSLVRLNRPFNKTLFIYHYILKDVPKNVFLLNWPTDEHIHCTDLNYELMMTETTIRTWKVVHENLKRTMPPCKLFFLGKGSKKKKSMEISIRGGGANPFHTFSIFLKLKMWCLKCILSCFKPF